MKLRQSNVFNRVCLSVCPQGSHVTIAHDALGLTIQKGPPSPALLWPWPLLVTSGGQDQRPVQTCSLGDPPGADI